MKQLSFLLLCTVISAAAMENINSAQPLANGPQNTLSTQSTAYNIRNNCKRYSDDSYEPSSKKRKRLYINAKKTTPPKNIFNNIILKNSLIEACKKSLANTTRYFLYIQCMDQNILYRLKNNEYRSTISQLSQLKLTQDQLRGIYNIIKLPNTKTDEIQEVNDITFRNLEEFNELQKKIKGEVCEIGEDEGFKIFQLIYNYLSKNHNKSIEDALEFCKYGFKKYFAYATINDNWIKALRQKKHLHFYILNYLAILTGQTAEGIESEIKEIFDNNITIRKPVYIRMKQDEEDLSLPDINSPSIGWNIKQEDVSFFEDESNSPDSKTALESILDYSLIKACKESLAEATRYFLYIQCMGQNILYHIKDNKYSFIISQLSQSHLTPNQLRGIYEIIKLPNTKTDGIKKVDGIKLWNLGEFNKLQRDLIKKGKDCKIGEEKGFQIFNLIYNYLIKNSNKSVEEALDFCKYGFKKDFVYTTIKYNWVQSLTTSKNLPFYILNYLAIVTGQTVERIERRVENNNITIKRLKCEKAATMKNTSSAQLLANGAKNTLLTQSMPYNIRNNGEQNEENILLPEDESDYPFRDFGEQDEENRSFSEDESDYPFRDSREIDEENTFFPESNTTFRHFEEIDEDNILLPESDS